MPRSIHRRYAGTVLLAIQLSGCTSWRTQHVAPQQVLQDSNLVRRGVRVTTLDGQRYQIRHPALRSDTLTDIRDTTSAAIPLGQVRQLQVRRPSAPRTALLVAGSLVGAAAATLGVACIMLCGYVD
jgi:hypothetical protein